MAKRARLMTTEDVLGELDHKDDFDDFDEQCCQEGNDEFSDCVLEDGEDEQHTLPPQLRRQVALPT